MLKFSNRFRYVVFGLLLFVPSSILAQQGTLSVKADVKDQLGGLIAGASIKLIHSLDGTIKVTTTDKNGEFKINNLNRGRYSIVVSAPGFAPYDAEIEVGSLLTDSLSIVLFPLISETVEVSRDGEKLDPEQLSGTQILKAAELQDLPDDSDDLKVQLQNLAATSGSTPGEAVVTVDGFLNEGRLPAKSAIREVRVNPNIYSAEYDTPPFRGGRIEIFTKPGAAKLSGLAFLNHNSSSFNARNPLVAERAATQTQRYGFQLGGPIVSNRSGILVDLEKRDIDESVAINAVTLSESFQVATLTRNVANPRKLIVGSVRNDWQIGTAQTFVLRYDFASNKSGNVGVGGLNLPSRGFDLRQTENSFRLSHTATPTTRLVNEFRVGFTSRNLELEALSDDLVVNVAGSFISGGADITERTLNEKVLELNDSLIVDAGKHTLKLGAQVFNYRTNEAQLENQKGTFFFGGRSLADLAGPTSITGLEQYRRSLLGLSGGTPTRFVVRQGPVAVKARQWQFASFIQDEWKPNPKVLLSLGFRAETQTLPADKLRFAPRLGFAYSPDKQQTWVLRVRTGLFYERVDDSLALESLRHDGVQTKQILIDEPSFPDPLVAGLPNTVVQTQRVLNPNLRAPVSLQMRVELERQLTKEWKVSSSYSWTEGWSQLHSRNINAPILTGADQDPRSAVRPLGTSNNILQFESNGRIKGRVLYVGVNQNANKLFSVNAGYLLFDFKTNADSAFSFPQSSYDLTGEWSRPSWQSRHRVFLSSAANLPQKFRLSAFLNVASGTPFDVRTGSDNNGDGIFNDRPSLTTEANTRAIKTTFGLLDPFAVNGGLTRNPGTNPTNVSLDLNLSRTFSLKKDQSGDGWTITTNIRGTNVLNRANLRDVNGVLTSPLFGQPNSANPPRRIELGVRFNF